MAWALARLNSRSGRLEHSEAIETVRFTEKPIPDRPILKRNASALILIDHERQVATRTALQVVFDSM
jgi:hypothetical protein